MDVGFVVAVVFSTFSYAIIIVNVWVEGKSAKMRRRVNESAKMRVRKKDWHGNM